MYNYIKCKKKLDVSDEITEKLGITWPDITFIIEPLASRVGEFLIRSNGQLCHKVVVQEDVDESQIGEPGVIWGGTGYCRILSSDWESVQYTGNISVEATILGETADADVKIDFGVEDGFVLNHEVNLNLVDNAPRKEHDKRIKKLAIKRAKRMNTWWYRLYNSSIRKPLKYTRRIFFPKWKTFVTKN